MSILKVEHLSHQFQDGDQVRKILNDVSHEFEQGKVYSILGYSGSGKTTLISMLAGLDKPKQGIIYYDDKPITEIGLTKYRRNYVSTVFQQYNLIKYMSAIDNVKVAFGITDNEMPGNRDELAINLLDFVGIVETKAKRKVSKLSGGEQQRVAIARSLATDVDLIFADEPTGNLDTETEMAIIEIFKQLATKYNKCIIIVTHSDIVAKQTDTIFRLKDGILTEETGLHP